MGSDQVFGDIRAAVSIPMLRKDFTVDEYQIYQARLLGAEAVLLICALLDTRTIARYLELCGELGLSAVVLTTSGTEKAMLFLMALCLAGGVAAKLYLGHGGSKDAHSQPHKTQIAGNDNFFGEEDHSDK